MKLSQAAGPGGGCGHSGRWTGQGFPWAPCLGLRVRVGRREGQKGCAFGICSHWEERGHLAVGPRALPSMATRSGASPQSVPLGGRVHLLLRGRGQGPGHPEEEQAVLFEVPISSHPPTPAPEQTARLPSLPPRWGLPPHGPQWTSGIREKEVRQGDVAHGTPSSLPTPYFPALLADWPAVRRAAGGAQGVPGR